MGSGSLDTDGLSRARMTVSQTALAAGSLKHDVNMGDNCGEGAHSKKDFPFFTVTTSNNFWTIPM